MTTNRIDIFLESLAWYFGQRKARAALFFIPHVVLPDLWRQAGRRADAWQKTEALERQVRAAIRRGDVGGALGAMKLALDWVVPTGASAGRPAGGRTGEGGHA